MSSRETIFAAEQLLRTFIEINREIAAILDLDRLLQKIAELTHRIVPYQIFAIMLLDEEKDELYHRFAIGYGRDVEAVRVKVGTGITGTAVKERRPIVVDDVRNDPRYINVVERARSELAVPLIAQNRVVGVLDIESPEVGYFKDEQVMILDLLASQIAIAIENARIYQSERQNRQMLALLFNISLDMGSTLEVDELVHKIAEAVNSVIHYNIFSILLIDHRRNLLRPRIVIRYNAESFEKHEVPLDKGLVGYSASRNVPVRVPDVSKDPRYINVHPETRSELAVPLTYKGKVIGVLDLESTEINFFNDYHERLLMTLAIRVALALVNAELYEKVSDNEARMERELNIAREIQHQLLPDEVPEMPPLDIATSIVPLQELGGDLYDFIHFDDGRLAIAVGDVAGKGLPAALYGALASGIIRARATRKYLPGQMLELVNKSLAQRPIESQYVALIYAVYDPKSRKVTMANSGFPYPLFSHEGRCAPVELAGTPLGMFPESRYHEAEVILDPGDVLLFYSDGLIEAHSTTDEEFGLRRLADVLCRVRGKSAAEIVAAIVDAVRQHSGSCPQDDQTVVALRMGGP